jgi:class 3 adenylate cyclase
VVGSAKTDLKAPSITSASPPSLRTRIGNPLDWQLPHRCTLAALLALLFVFWINAIAHYLLRNPDTAPYVSRSAVLVLSHLAERAFITEWLLLAALGIILGRWQISGSHVLAHTITQSVGLQILLFGYCLGLSTAVFFGLTAMGSFIVGMLLLEASAVIPAAAVVLSGYVGLTIAEQLGKILYAPLLIEAPFKNGHLARSWLTTFGMVDLTFFIVISGLVYFVLKRWRVREQQLAEANRFLSRFLSPQVARIANELGMANVIRKNRSQLTAIQCDLRGFTAFSERAAPEEVTDLLEQYYAAIGEAVSESGGTIKDYSGDGVLILVGAPTPYPDHATRAVSIAFGIRERVIDVLARFQSMGLELSVGVGLASGYVTVGAIGGAERLEYVAVGPAVNLASRLCDHAKSASILVDQRTVGLIGKNSPFRFEPMDSAELKGFSRPVKIFEVIGGA